MTIDDQIRDEKLQHDINRQADKISALSSAKTDRYEDLTVEDLTVRRPYEDLTVEILSS